MISVTIKYLQFYTITLIIVCACYTLFIKKAWMHITEIVNEYG